MSPYREPAETLIDERFDIDVGRLDITITYVTSPSSNSLNTVKIVKCGSYYFQRFSDNSISPRISKPNISSLLDLYHSTGFVTYEEKATTIAIPIHLIVEISFKESNYVVKIDPNTNQEYLKTIESGKKRVR